jgi:hypothetical protein
MRFWYVTPGETMSEYQSYIEGPRWAGVRQVLVDCAQTAGVHIETSESKGLIRVTVYFTVTGPDKAVASFRSLIDQSVADYVARTGR